MSVQEAAVSLLERVLFYVGIDWGTERHAVFLLDVSCDRCAQWSSVHGIQQAHRPVISRNSKDFAVRAEREGNTVSGCRKSVGLLLAAEYQGHRLRCLCRRAH